MEKESLTLRMARKYVNQYKWSVIPLKPNSKEPLIPWQEFQKRLPTDQELMKWFQGTSNGLGIVTGQLSNLSVLDADQLEAVTKLKVSSPISVLTRRGKHLYFKYSGETNSASKIAEHVDVRGEGGFVVASPSTINGHTYRFLNPYFRIDMLPVFPSQLLPQKETTSRIGKPEGWIAEALQGMKIGNIDDTLVSVLGRLRRDGYSSIDALTLLRPHAEHAGATNGHLEEKIEHVWSTYENKKVSISNGISLSVDDFLSKESKVEWICFPLIPKQGLIFTAGLPESQKSWLLMDLAIEAATGGKWLQLFQTVRSKVLFVDQERALPETQRRFKALLAYKGINKEDLKDNLWVDCSSHRKLDLDISYESFKRELSAIKPDLVIIDSFITIHSKSDNDRTEVQKVLDRIKLLREEFGCAFTFIDHESKQSFQDSKENAPPSAMRMVGTIGKVAAADCVLSVTKLGQGLSSVTHTKSTMANPAEGFCFELKDETIGISIKGSK